MPRLLSSLTVLGVMTPAVLALPVSTAPAAAPHPVPASVARLSLVAAPAPLSVASGPGRWRAGYVLPQTPTRPFTTVGVTWRHDPAVGSVAAEVRWRSAAGWSTWRGLSGQSDDAPDVGSPDMTSSLRDGTAPLWVGPARGVQVRVTAAGGAAPVDVRVELVDPGVSAADATAGRTPPDTALAAEDAPPILTRADWGADESIRTGSPSYNSTVKVGFVHHTDTANDYSEAQTAAMIRSVYAYHVQSNGWSDIGYNYVVDRFGRIWEGRYGGITRAVIGAHTGGFNLGSFGTSLLGSYMTVEPSAATLAALERLFAWKLGSYYREPLGTAPLTSHGGTTSKYAAGVVHTFAVVSGHRDAGSTSCPGDATYARMGSIRSAIGSFLGTGFVEPAISTSSVPFGSSAPVVVSSGSRNRPAWTVDITGPEGLPVRTFAGSPGTPINVSWDLTDATGVPVLPGSYTLRLRGVSADGDPALPWSTTVFVAGPTIPKGAWMSPGDYSTRFGSAPTQLPPLVPTPLASPVG